MKRKPSVNPENTDRLPPKFHAMVKRVLAYRPSKADDRRAARKQRAVESTG